MKTPFGLLALLAWMSHVAAAQQAVPPPQTPAPARPAEQLPSVAQFEARTDIVLVDVTVVSSNGDPVTGLEASDFSLEVNGKPRSVHTLQFISSLGMKAAPEAPRLADVSSNDGASSGRLLLFVVDENYLRVGAARAVLRTAERVMAKLPPGDLVGLARLPSGRGGVEFTTDRARIRRALSGIMGGQPTQTGDKVRLGEAHAFETNDQSTWQQVISRECGAEGGGIGGVGASMARQACIEELEAQAKFVVSDAKARTRLSISSFEQLSQQLALFKTPVNIVLLSEGLYLGRDRNDLAYLAKLAAQARISFFVVQPDESIFDMDSPRTVGGLPPESALAEGLEQLAGVTRGEYFKVSTSGDGAFDRIARELTGYYLLSFEPTEADKTSRDRRIKVEVKRRGLTVRSRSTYALEDPTTAIATLPPLEQVKSLLQAPLPSAGLKMRVATYSVANPQDDRVRVIIAAEIGDAATAPAEWPVGLVIANNDGKILVNNAAQMKLSPATDRTESARLFLMTVVLEPGEYILRLAAADGRGAAGSVHHNITARLPEIDGNAVRASDLILSPMVAVGEAPRPIPSSILYSENMAAILELASPDAKQLADTRVSVQIAESENGPALVTVPAQAIPRVAGQRSFVASLKLGVLPPGEYVARAVVTLPGRADAHVTRSFRLAPVATAADTSPIAFRVAGDDAPAPLPMARIVAPVAKFVVDDVLAPEFVRGFLDDLQQSHPVSAASAPIVQQARNGTYLSAPPDSRTPDGDEPMLSFIRGLAQLQKKQYAQAAAWFQLSLKGASDFLGAAFYLGAVHAATGRDNDAMGAWQLSLLNGGKNVYPMLVDATLRIGDGQGALELIAEAPEAWPSDEARLRRVATAQAMLGQFDPAMETLHGLLARRTDDTDLLFIALQVLYRQHLARELPASERTRFDEYSKRYVDARGAEAALVETWRRYVLR